MRILVLAVIAAMMTTPAFAEIAKEQAVEKSKEMVKELGGGLKGKLQEAVKASGFGGAISVCKETALVRAKEVGDKFGGSIRRVSAKTRNPQNVPDPFEADILAKMEHDHQAGKPQEAYVEVLTGADGKKSLRFMKPIVTEALCLNCHGAPDKINPDAAKAIELNYPNDKATGYSADQVRGAFSVVYPMN
jgi:hypothetical protein